MIKTKRAAVTLTFEQFTTIYPAAVAKMRAYEGAPVGSPQYVMGFAVARARVNALAETYPAWAAQMAAQQCA